jgi:hypothetical protein
MTQQGRNMYECVMIDDKTLFVHLLVISVFSHYNVLQKLANRTNALPGGLCPFSHATFSCKTRCFLRLIKHDAM